MIDRALGGFEFADVAHDTMRQRLVKSEEGDRPHSAGRPGLRGRRLRRSGGTQGRRHGGRDGAGGQRRAIDDELRRRFPDIEVDNLNMCWVQTGPYRSRVGHIMNAHRVVQKGEMISVNPYAIIGGYYHVLERSLYWGHIPDNALAVFKINVEAHHAGLRTLRAGIKCSDVDKVVNPIYREAGLLEGRSFGTGHSVGIMSIWFGREEGGELRQYNDTVLEENMVVTMEPMVNVDGLGGFRHHDICRITADGIENLNTFPRGVLLAGNGGSLEELWLPA